MTKSLAKHYTTELRRNLSHLATWLPNDRVALGDIGIMDGDRFIPTSTLKTELGIAVGGVRTAKRGDISHRSAGVVTVGGGALGRMADPASGLGKVGVDVEVSFSRESAILLDLYDCRSTRIEDQLTLGEQVLSAWRGGAWRADWCVVTEIVEAKSSTVLVSSKRDARIRLAASASAQLAEGPSLAGAGLKLRRVHRDGIGLELLTRPGTTPLLKGLRLKKRFWAQEPTVVIEGLEPVGDEDPFGGDSAYADAFDVLGDD